MDISDLKKDSRRYKQLPSWNQWKRLPRALSKKEKFALVLFLILILGSITTLGFNYYYQNTTPRPARGGTFVEGMVGQPRFINPIYVSSNDVDRSLVQLTFASLLRYNQQGEIVPNLARDCHTEQGKVWTVTLKDDLTWQDGQPITAEDVVYTVEVMQSSDYKSPQRVNWMGVEVSKVSSQKIKFELDSAYSQFSENLTSKIIPKHIWEEISPANFPLSSYNLNPIGSGPYQVENINKEKDRIKSLTLVRDLDYHSQPYLDKIVFKFYRTQQQLIEAAKNGAVDGIGSPEKIAGFKQHSFSLPRYFSVFFNVDSEPLTEKSIRRALNYATDKEQIVNEVAEGQATPVNSPILPSIFNYQKPTDVYDFNLEEAKRILEEEGFKDTDGDGIRERKKDQFKFTARLKNGSEGEQVKKLQQCLVKEVEYNQDKVTGYFGNTTKQGVIDFQEKYEQDILKPWGYQSGTGVVGETTREKLNQVCFDQPGESLEINLVLVDQNRMKQVAQILKEQWKKAGIKLTLNPVSLSELKTKHIKPRSYQALLFGESLGLKPDFYSFWHSSQVRHPGLNLSKFESDRADEILEKANQTLEAQRRAELYQDFQQILIDQAPAVFLYNPNFIYNTSRIKGVEPSLIVNPAHRFTTIEDWFLKTKRVWKSPSAPESGRN